MKDGIMKIKCPKCGEIICIHAFEERDPKDRWCRADYSHTIVCSSCNMEIRGDAKLMRGPAGIYDVIEPTISATNRKLPTLNIHHPQISLKHEDPLPNISIQDRTPKNLDRLLQHISLPPADPLDQLAKEEKRTLRESFPRYYKDCLQAGLTHEQIHAIVNLIKSITA